MNRRVLEIEKEIIRKTNEMNEFTLKYSIEVGKLLCEAKGELKHGEWGTWISRNLPFSHATANDLMRIYRNYKDRDPREMIMQMNAATANELTKIGEELREEVAKKIIENGYSVREAKIFIAEMRGEHKGSEKIKHTIECKERKIEELKKEIADLYRILADLTMQED